MWSRWTYFLGVGQGGSTNLDAGGLLASLAVQAYGFKSLKFGQDQDWCMTGGQIKPGVILVESVDSGRCHEEGWLLWISSL